MMEELVSNRVLPTTYEPRAVEERWMEFWAERGYFHAHATFGRPRYCITIPPPNVTGELHLGHALQHAIHDAIIRWQRMLGKETLCVPGTDHAGIATQMKVERQLASEGLTKYDLGREKFIERMWQWKEHYGGAILRQLRRFGASYDWSRERFTLDAGYVKAVMTSFVHLYDKGLIYRGTRIINWCPGCETAISDLELEHEERQGHLWHIRYPFADGDAGEGIVVATTRPETMLGDTAVAVNPNDERYRALVGREVMLPLMHRRIPIIADDFVDPQFGTGAVKVTPAHDPNDAEIGRRHHLPAPVVIGKKAEMTAEAGPYVGMNRYDARAAILTALQEQGLLVKTQEHEHAVGACARCGETIEPLLSEQWFVNMEPLAKHVLTAIRAERIQYQPERFARYSEEWLENIRDWCISRQLWWGHRIPVYTCTHCGHQFAAVETPRNCPVCPGETLEQDPDVLDTWFSSALWPFAVLGWPERTPELAYFYPTDLMITARDILYLWVARMIFSGMEYLPDHVNDQGQPDTGIPFYHVYVHPTVQNFEGKRMSKSLGTGVDPLELMDQYGTDATRYGLCGMATATQDVRLQESREPDWDPARPAVGRSFPTFVQGRNFANKIWNASRFVLMNLQDETQAAPIGESVADHWILARYALIVQNVNIQLENYRLDQAVMSLYSFFWSEFCDWYIEMAKPSLRSEDEELANKTRSTLAYVLENCMRLLHPFMPFITEEIWQQLPHSNGAKDSIMISSWPEEKREWLMDELFGVSVQIVEEVFKPVIMDVRDLRFERSIVPTDKIIIKIYTTQNIFTKALQTYERYIIQQVNAERIEVSTDLSRASGKKESVYFSAQNVEPLPNADMDLFWVDISHRELSAEERQQEIEKAARELLKLDAEIEKLAARLATPNFVDKAPAPVVEKARADLAELHHRKAGLAERVKGLQG